MHILALALDALDPGVTPETFSGKASALAGIRRIMALHGLSASDVAPTGKRKYKSPVAPKYRDPESGATWSGRGLKPRWLTAALASGKKLEDFAV